MTKLRFKIFLSVVFFSYLTVVLFKDFGRSAMDKINILFEIVYERKMCDLRIIVIVYDRAESLLRLLNSLNGAEYDSDLVKLEVWIDRSVEGQVDNITLKTARDFIFKHGEFEVHVHSRHVGIVGQWLTTWKPPEDNSEEIAVILEDDLTVSKYFWRYLKTVHRKYDTRSNINGYSLQGHSITLSNKHPTTTLRGPLDKFVFLYPVLGSWGFSPNTKHWKKFLEWFAGQDASILRPYVPGNIASDWYESFSKQGKANTMWTMWHIYYAWKNDEFTLHCNFPENAGLTTNWREKGLHILQTEGSANKLITKWKAEYENLPDNPPYVNLSGHFTHY